LGINYNFSEQGSAHISRPPIQFGGESTYNNDNKDKNDNKDYNGIIIPASQEANNKGITVTASPALNNNSITPPASQDNLLKSTLLNSINPGSVVSVISPATAAHTQLPPRKPGAGIDFVWRGTGTQPDPWAPPPMNEIAGMVFNRIHPQVVFELQTVKNKGVVERKPYWSMTLNIDSNLQDLPTWEHTDKCSFLMLDQFYNGEPRGTGWDNAYRWQECNGRIDGGLYPDLQEWASPESSKYDMGGMLRLRTNPNVKNGWEYTTAPVSQKHPTLVALLRFELHNGVDEIDVGDPSHFVNIRGINLTLVYDHQVFSFPLRRKQQKGYWWHAYYKPTNNNTPLVRLPNRLIIKK